MRGAARQSNPMNPDPAVSVETNVRLLTVKEAAAACQISERQLRRLISSGEVPAKRFGKAIRIHPRYLGL